jgi:hypothetical protein
VVAQSRQDASGAAQEGRDAPEAAGVSAVPPWPPEPPEKARQPVAGAVPGARGACRWCGRRLWDVNNADHGPHTLEACENIRARLDEAFHRQERGEAKVGPDAQGVFEVGF